jgi:hypothetical protein
VVNCKAVHDDYDLSSGTRGLGLDSEPGSRAGGFKEADGLLLISPWLWTGLAW